ncbi:sugar O-acyltransferase (sialic acid O-acetyltransferase NeuD family) [Christiangramia gaetbulicola]|uniref:Sugar O-acyltransferase (Sialic acid O-acetyltransferase NeuD family) n=1 Tax=Christiangramia gaetbulicola TaxID=703340 RepID=A0A2T6AFL5_9FLAO|nr:acetyltransferase [Christiangramia gaetbulicola]PTX42605.1 sugar O-acyltransferase (sialic acid O-acetyltransferase NeuD family) [Christiangramia gaetbulicola]
MLDKLVTIVGYSGHGLVVADAAVESGIKVKYYVEKKASKYNPFNLEYLGDESKHDFTGFNKSNHYILGIGNNYIRRKVVASLIKRDIKIINVIHPNSSFSRYMKIGHGNFISRNVSVNIGVEIGDYTILNTSSIIEHECRIGDYSHIGPGATLAGNVIVGENSFIGANSVIKQGVKIGDNVVIGAGTVVISDVIDDKTIVGNPGRYLMKR